MAVANVAGEVEGEALLDDGAAVTLGDGDSDGAGRDVTDGGGASGVVPLADGPALLACVPQPTTQTVTAIARTAADFGCRSLVLIAHPLSTYMTRHNGHGSTAYLPIVRGLKSSFAVSKAASSDCHNAVPSAVQPQG